MRAHGPLRSFWTGIAVGALVAAAAGTGVVRIVDATTSSGPRAVFEPLTPARILDTRNGTGTGGIIQPLASGVDLTLQVTGVGGVPSDATAVVLNVTVTKGTVSSWLWAWPANQTMPNASALNWSANQMVANMVTLTLSPAGQVKFRNANGTVELIADVAGYYHGHDHDDRYYTKAQLDAPVQHEVSIPIGALATVPSMSTITEVTSGLEWTNDYTEAAAIHIARPADWDGTSDVVVRLLFRKSAAASGAVSFFVRPRDFNAGDPWADDSTIVATSPTTATTVFQTMSIPISASTLQKAWWEITIQRDPTDYTGTVIVAAVTMLYTG